jgi:hypothetical protein
MCGLWSTENKPYDWPSLGKDLDYIIIGIDRLVDEFRSVPAIDILPDSLAAS